MPTQKSLDKLRREYVLLLKPGYQSPPQGRAERRHEIEQYFGQVGQPLEAKSTHEAFREMVLLGRINELANEGVQEGIAATAAVRKKSNSDTEL